MKTTIQALNDDVVVRQNLQEERINRERQKSFVKEGSAAACAEPIKGDVDELITRIKELTGKIELAFALLNALLADYGTVKIRISSLSIDLFREEIPCNQ